MMMRHAVMMVHHVMMHVMMHRTMMHRMMFLGKGGACYCD
jgi:hypothetical protein